MDLRKYLRRRPRVAAAQIVLSGLAVWGVVAPNPSGSMSTVVAWWPQDHNPKLVDTSATYGQPAPWLVTYRRVNQWGRSVRFHISVVNLVVPPALLLVAFNLPLAVAGLFRPPVDGRPTRRAVAWAAAGLCGPLVSVLRDRFIGRLSWVFVEPSSDPTTVVLSLLGCVVGFVIGWLFGNTPAATTPPAA